MAHLNIDIGVSQMINYCYRVNQYCKESPTTVTI